MTPELIIALGAWGAIAVLLGMLWQHTSKCNDRHEKFGEMIEAMNNLRSSIDKLEKAVGGTDGGIVLQLHQLKNDLSELVPGYTERRNYR